MKMSLIRTLLTFSCRSMVLTLLTMSTIRSEKSGEIITNDGMNKRYCQSDNNCQRGERCEKLCFWLHPDDEWLGCKIVCVRMSDRPWYFFKVTESNPTADSAPNQMTTLSWIEYRLRNLLNIRDNFEVVKKTTVLPLLDDETSIFENNTFLSERCPTPPICDKDCGVFVDIDGCQKCSCIERGPFKCLSDLSCFSWQTCYNGLCRCKRGYEESAVNPGQCLPSSLNDVQSPFEPLPFIANDERPLPKLNDILDYVNERTVELAVQRNTLESGNRKDSDNCQNDKDCAENLVCCVRVFCDELENCRRTKLCLQNCLTFSN